MIDKKPTDNNDASEPMEINLNQTERFQDSPYPTSDELLKKRKKSLPIALIAAIVGLVALILIVLYMQFVNKSTADENPEVVVGTPAPPQQEPEVNEPASAVDLVPANAEGDVQDETGNSLATNLETSEEIGNNLENIPDPEEILNAPIPESETLVKEEIQRLADEEQRLKEQEALLSEQVAMMDELNEKKEEQVALLEQQIAQLEQQNSAQ